MNKINYILFFLFASFSIFAQNKSKYGKFNSYYYSQNDFKSGAQIWSGAQGVDGKVYFGNNNYVLSFNGIDWKLVRCDTAYSGLKLVQSVHNTMVTKVYTSKNGKTFVGRYDNFGEIRYSKKGEEIYHPLYTAKIEKEIGQVWNIFEIKNTIYFVGENKIFKYDNLKNISEVRSIVNDDFSCKIAAKIDDGILLNYKNEDEVVYVYFNAVLNKSTVIKLPSYIENLTIGGIIKIGDFWNIFNLNGEVYRCKLENNKFTWDSDVNKSFDFLKSYDINSAKLNNNLIYISTKKNGVIVSDLKGNLIRKFDLNDGMENLNVLDLFHDRENNLWLCLDNGIHFFETSSPLTYFDKKDGLIETINCINNTKNKQYIGTATDIWETELSENHKRFKSTKIVKQQIFDLQTYKTSFGEKTIAIASNGIFDVNFGANRADLLSEEYAWSTYQNPLNKDEFFVACETSLGKLSLNNSKWEYKTIVPDLNGNILNLTSIKGKLIFGVENKGVFVYNIKSRKLHKVSHPKKSKIISNYVVTTFQDKVYVGMESGLYYISDDLKKMLPFEAIDKHFIGDSHLLIHRIFNDQNKKLWLVLHNEKSEKQFEHGYLEFVNNKWNWVSWPFEQINLSKDGLSFDIKRINANEVWFASGSAIYSFYESSITNSESKFNVEIDEVLINSVRRVFNPLKSSKIGALEYKYNSLNFVFHANSFKGMKNMKYRYKLDSYMDDWSEYSDLNFADFKKLNEGKYTLKIQAKNIYNFESEVLNYEFTILPPWYRTWWAYIIYFISFFILLYLLIQLSVKRVKNQNIKLEQIVVERTSEIADQNTKLEHQKAEIIQKTQDIVDSIIYAKRIQDTILPTDRLHEMFKEHFVFYRPKDIVSGDFYWARTKGDLVIFSAIDCTGHGVPGALVSIVGNSSLLRCVNEHKLLEPSQILDKHREIVVKSFVSKSHSDVKDGMDMSLCVLDKKTLVLKYAGANNDCLIIRNKQLIELKADKQPIGQFSHSKPFLQHEIQLLEGDCVYQYTDGFVDQFGGEKGKKLKSRPFKEMLLEISHLSMDKQSEMITTFFETWKGDLDQIDDVCVFGIKV